MRGSTQLWYTDFESVKDLAEARGHKYGMSVFETVALHCGRPILLQQHLNRLSDAWGMLMPDASETRARHNEVQQIFSECCRPDLTGMVRIQFSAGPGTFLSPSGDAKLTIQFEAAELGTGGRALDVSVSQVPILPARGGWKTGNYWSRVDAFREAKLGGADEAIVKSPAGNIIGGAFANLILHVGNLWLTPSRGTGARDGVVLAWLQSHLKIREERLTEDHLERCSSAAILNSRLGVAPVRELNRRTLDLSTDISSLAQLYDSEFLHA